MEGLLRPITARDEPFWALRTYLSGQSLGHTEYRSGLMNTPATIRRPNKRLEGTYVLAIRLLRRLSLSCHLKKLCPVWQLAADPGSELSTAAGTVFVSHVDRFRLPATIRTNTVSTLFACVCISSTILEF